MKSRLGRTLVIFRLALSYWGDSRRIARIRRSYPKNEAQHLEDRVLSEGARRFLKTALTMGGLIIKVGQFLSARTDMLPLAFTRELTTLQDQVPSAPFAAVKKIMVEEWGALFDTGFAHIESEPLAAASLGQVHRAELRDGRAVAVKVQRPGITHLADIDLSALRIIMRVLARSTRLGRRINAVRLFEEFEGLVRHELDYRDEAEYLSRFRKNFQDNGDVVVPKAIGEFTRRRVFVMDYAGGIKLTDKQGLLDWELDPRGLAQILIRAYLQQIAVDGFVQIDPHPGNFFADKDGRIIFLDFGMMAEIPSQELDAVGNLLQGILLKNAEMVVGAVDTLGFVRPHASRRLLKRAIEFLLNQLSGVPLAPGPALDVAVAEFQDFLYQEPLEFPARYMFLGRAVGMLFGLISGLDPDLDWIQVLRNEALPLLMERQQQQGPEWVRALGDLAGAWLGSELGMALSQAVGLAWRRALMATQVPGQWQRVLTNLESGELSVVPELTPLLRKIDRLTWLTRAQLFLTWVIVLGGAAFFLHRVFPGQAWLPWILGGLAVLLGLRAWWSARRDLVHRP